MFERDNGFSLVFDLLIYISNKMDLIFDLDLIYLRWRWYTHFGNINLIATAHNQVHLDFGFYLTLFPLGYDSNNGRCIYLSEQLIIWMRTLFTYFKLGGLYIWVWIFHTHEVFFFNMNFEFKCQKIVTFLTSWILFGDLFQQYWNNAEIIFSGPNIFFLKRTNSTPLDKNIWI